MKPADLLWPLMLLFGAHSDGIIIIQTPSIDVFERENVHLPCTYITPERQTNGAFRWYKECKNRSCMVSDNSTEYIGRIAMSDRQSFRANTDASITIIMTRLADSGIYYCQVEMFDVGTKTGPGTILTVKPEIDRKIKVFQTPPSIEATEGETVHLLCTYNTSEVQHTGAFSWFKDVRDGTEGSRLSSTSAKYSGRIIEVQRSTFKANRNASIAIANVNHNDSGTYYCQVEILFFGKFTGAGTVLMVKHTNHPEKRGKSMFWQLFILGVKLAVFIALILLTIYLVHFCESRGPPVAIGAVQEEVELTDSYV